MAKDTVHFDNLQHLGLGKRTRLHRILAKHESDRSRAGPLCPGTALLLSIDQGLEDGPRDFFSNPAAINPDFQLRLAQEGAFSGIVLQIGLAEKYYWNYAGEVPLVLKLNGRTSIPSDRTSFSPLLATVRDAVRLGADAVGYTFYVGSSAQDQDFLQYQRVREEAEVFGMPLILWAYPRGEAIESKGGRDSLFAVDYAARLADEVGADLVRLNEPSFDAEKNKLCPPPYNTLCLSREEALAKVVRTANKTMVLISGGSHSNEEELLTKTRLAMEAGATGMVFGRNLWSRPLEESLRLVSSIRQVMEACRKSP